MHALEGKEDYKMLWPAIVSNHGLVAWCTILSGSFLCVCL